MKLAVLRKAKKVEDQFASHSMAETPSQMP